jgi:hypothetical protein
MDRAVRVDYKEERNDRDRGGGPGFGRGGFGDGAGAPYRYRDGGGDAPWRHDRYERRDLQQQNQTPSNGADMVLSFAQPPNPVLQPALCARSPWQVHADMGDVRVFLLPFWAGRSAPRARSNASDQ